MSKRRRRTARSEHSGEAGCCEHCGTGGRGHLRRVPVEPIGTNPDVRALALCPRCVRPASCSTWRLRYTPTG